MAAGSCQVRRRHPLLARMCCRPADRWPCGLEREIRSSHSSATGGLAGGRRRIAQHRSRRCPERRDFLGQLDDLMPAGQQDEPGPVEPVPRCSSVATEQVGRGPAEVEGLLCPAAFEQSHKIALHPWPALRRYSLCSIGREDGAATIGDIARQAADALSEWRCSHHVGRFHCRQQRHNLGLVLPHQRQQVVRATARAPTAAACLPRARPVPPPLVDLVQQVDERARLYQLLPIAVRPW